MTDNTHVVRNANYTGETGQFNTVWNTLVRVLGLTKAKEIRSNKELYKDLSFFINEAANFSYRELSTNVRHPKWKVPAFFGMSENTFNKLKNQKRAYVAAYQSDWLLSKVSFWLKDNNIEGGQNANY